MLYQAETSKKKCNSLSKKDKNPQKLSFLNSRVEGVLTVQDEEEKNPLKTNLSVNCEIFMIEDGK